MMKQLLFDIKNNDLYVKTENQKSFKRFVILQDNETYFVGENNNKSNVEQVSKNVYKVDEESCLLFSHIFNVTNNNIIYKHYTPRTFNSILNNRYTRRRETEEALFSLKSDKVILFDIHKYDIRSYPKSYLVETGSGFEVNYYLIKEFFGTKPVNKEKKVDQTLDEKMKKIAHNYWYTTEFGTVNLHSPDPITGTGESSVTVSNNTSI